MGEFQLFQRIIILIASLSSISSAQDSLVTFPLHFKFGLGVDAANPIAGPHCLAYYEDFSLGLTYGLPSNSYSNNVIKQIDFGYLIKIGYAFGYLSNEKIVAPIYAGFGFASIKEKPTILLYTGSGSIVGTCYFIGIRFFPGNDPIIKNVGAHIEFGKSNWNYDDSILKKNNSLQKYNYPEFYLSFGTYYYIF